MSMQSNSYKVKTKDSTRNSIFSLIEKLLNMDVAIENGLPLKFVPYVLYITLIGIFYIGNSHYTDKKIRHINRLEIEVEELRADYTSLKAEYMFSSKQSEVAKKVKKIGLEESLQPPIKIKVAKGEY